MLKRIINPSSFKIMSLCWLVLIYWRSATPQTVYDVLSLVAVLKLRHAAYFSVLAVLLTFGWCTDIKNMTLSSVLKITVLVMVLGFTDEMVQWYFSTVGREFSFFDVLTDLLCSFVVAFVIWQWGVGGYSALVSYLRGDLIRLVSSNIFNNAVTFLTGFMIAAIVGPAEFGVYSVAVSVLMIILAVSELGVGSSVVRRCNIFRDEESKRRALRAGMTIRYATSGVLALLSVPLGWAISHVISPSRPIMLEATLACFCAAVLGLWSYIRTVQQARHRYEQYSSLTVRYGLTRLIAVIALFMLGIRDPIYYLLALYMVGPVVTIILALGELPSVFSSRQDRMVREEIVLVIKYGKWVLMSALSYPICFSLPLFMLMHEHGPAAAGQYSLGLMFAGGITPLSDAVRTFVLPKITSLRNDAAAFDFMRMTFRLSIPFLFALGALMILSAGLFEFFFRSKYADGLVTVEVLVAAAGLALYWGIPNSLTNYLNIPNLDAEINLGRVVAAAVLGWLLIPRFSVVGALASSTIPIVIGEVIMFMIVRKRLKSRQPQSILIS